MICVLCMGCNGSTNEAPVEAEGEITAAYRIADVNSLTRAVNKGLLLMNVWSEEVNPDGTSERWCYEYVATTLSTLPEPTYYFHATYSTVEFDSNSTLKCCEGIISHKWINSSVALYIAEKNGGSQFRSQNPHYTIRAGVGEPVVPDPKTYWYITYRSKEDRTKLLSLTIDANSIASVSKYP